MLPRAYSSSTPQSATQEEAVVCCATNQCHDTVVPGSDAVVRWVRCATVVSRKYILVRVEEQKVVETAVVVKVVVTEQIVVVVTETGVRRFRVVVEEKHDDVDVVVDDRTEKIARFSW